MALGSRVTLRHGLAEGTGCKGGGTVSTELAWRQPPSHARGLSKTADGHARHQRAKKKPKKETTTMRFELTRFCWELIPDAEKMDFYVSHFLTGIISREKLAAEERSPVSEKR